MTRLLLNVVLFTTVWTLVPDIRAQTLLELAKTEFAPRWRLTAAEEKLFVVAQSGESLVADGGANNCGSGLDEASTWPQDCVVHAECIAWLCKTSKASALVASTGIQIQHAKIVGELQLARAVMHFPLTVQASVFDQNISLQGARLKSLSILESRAKLIDAEAVTVEDDFIVAGSLAEGICLRDSVIRGSLISTAHI